jgi:hypothetical protein
MEFQKFGKIPRLRRDIVITEKIDGTNAQIVVTDGGEVYTGSRNRWITPENDNYGFAKWVNENKDRIVSILGLGRHYGEWWGAGIQRRYEMGKKVFSLFNTKRFDRDSEIFNDDIRIVPVLYEGPWSDRAIADALMELAASGSVASPGFMRPEGVVIYHKAANSLYKVTLERDGGKWRLDEKTTESLDSR